MQFRKEFVNLAYTNRLIYSWEGWEHFAKTGKNACQLYHMILNKFCRAVSKPTQEPRNYSVGRIQEVFCSYWSQG